MQQATQSAKPLYSKDAEEALCGSALIDPGTIDRVDVAPDALYIHRNRWIWRAASILRQSGRDIDMVTVSEILDRQGKLEEAGGMAYLASLAMNTPSSTRAEEYARIVNDYARRRAWVTLAGKMAGAAYDLDTSLEDETGAIFDGLTNATTVSGGAVHVSYYADKVLAETIERMENPRDIWGIQTGYKDFDFITGGLQPPELMFVSGDPGIGKSIFADLGAYQMALNGTPGTVYSLEMPGTQMVRRYLSYLTKTKTRDMKSGHTDPDKIPALSREVELMRKIPLYISDSVRMTTTAMRADLARLKAQYGVRWFVLDYAYLLADGGNMSENDRTGAISARLKAICRGLDMAGIVILSMNKTDYGMPTGRSLRGSNQQFYDPDLLLFLVENKDEPNVVTCLFGKGRELENPREAFRLVRIPGYPAFGNYTDDKRTPF